VRIKNVHPSVEKMPEKPDGKVYFTSIKNLSQVIKQFSECGRKSGKNEIKHPKS
jgi:hypothetical protein